MSEERLRDLLARAVPPAPEIQLPAPAHRSLPTRVLVMAGAAIAVLVITFGGVFLLGGDDDTSTPAPLATPLSESTEQPPVGTRLVGIGDSAIAVPTDWATNALRCGTATEPTVVIDVVSVPSCHWSSPKVHDNVWIERGVNRQMFTPEEEFDLDGVPAERDRPRCRVVGTTTVCTGTVHLPMVKASYRAEASSAQRVAEILSWIRIVPDHVAVPGYERLNMKHQEDDPAEHYRARLEAMGLRSETVTTRRPRLKAGYVLEVSPSPGTMVSPGEVVTVSAVGAD